MSSIGALNQRSMLVRMSSLPTTSTTIVGTSVMREQQRHQLGAEPRERQAAAAFDDDLDDVACEHEDERREHREVGGGERVEDELGQEIGREARRPVGQRQNGDESHDQDHHRRQDERRVVAEASLFGRRHGRRPRGPSRRDGSDRCRHR